MFAFARAIPAEEFAALAGVADLISRVLAVGDARRMRIVELAGLPRRRQQWCSPAPPAGGTHPHETGAISPCGRLACLRAHFIWTN